MTSSESQSEPAPETTAEAIRVREAYPRDIPALVEFNSSLALESEDTELDRQRLTDGVRAVFEDPGLGSYFVAERGGEPVGALCVTREWSDWRNAVFWWIQSVYVVPSARRTGVFRRLYEFVESKARESRSVCGLRLYVERGNDSAKGVYDAVGMAHSHYDMFEVDFVLGSKDSPD